MTRRQLFVLAHECGHIVLHSSPPNNAKPSHVKEHEAEVYAHQAFRRYGVEVPVRTMQDGRRYVGQWIMKDKQAGVPIDPRAVLFALGESPADEALPALSGKPPKDFSSSIDRFVQ